MAENQEAKRSRSKPRSNFKDLKKISDKTLHSDAITIAWKAVRETVALKLMGERGSAVPYLHEANKYGLFNVLVREKRSVIDKATNNPTATHWSAPLENLLPPHIKVDKFRADNRSELVPEDYKNMVHYHLKNVEKEGKDASKDSTPCDVEIKLTEVNHYKITSNYQETAVDINKHFLGGAENIDKIYLITEVYFADQVVLNVRVGDNMYKWNSTGLTPVGFVFRTCEMSSGGILTFGPEVERKKLLEYNWIAGSKSTKFENATRDTLVKTTSAVPPNSQP